MVSFSDSEVIEALEQARANAVSAPREGMGTGRWPGSAGRIADEWMIWLAEAKRRGLR